jgi:hypothetical protein
MEAFVSLSKLVSLLILSQYHEVHPAQQQTDENSVGPCNLSILTA